MSHGCKTGRIISKNINYLEATGLRKLMMNCYLLDVHIDCCFIYENGCHELVKVGPLNMLCPRLLSRLHIILQGISSEEDISKNWWTEFSSWQDLRALLRTGTTLSIHRVVHYLRIRLQEINAYVQVYRESWRQWLLLTERGARQGHQAMVCYSRP